MSRTLHPTTAKRTLFSSAQGAFPHIDHILGHKTNLKEILKELKSYRVCSLTIVDLIRSQ